MKSRRERIQQRRNGSVPAQPSRPKQVADDAKARRVVAACIVLGVLCIVAGFAVFS